MKKKELPELKLNKRTIANLNSMEMKYVVRGNGDDENISKVNCELEPEKDAKSELMEKAKKIIISKLMIC